MAEGRDLAARGGDVAGVDLVAESGVADEPIDDIVPVGWVVKYGAKPGGIVPSGTRRRAHLLLTIAQLRYELGLLDEYGVPPAPDQRVRRRGGRFGEFL
jgi:hypothetical protein